MADDSPLRRTPAQWCGLVAGTLLVLFGLLGFAADTSFHTGNHVQGGTFVVFEVNGWSNLVHTGVGLLLLAAANTRPTARTLCGALALGALFFALWGLIDGDEILTLLPVNGADNLLHLGLALIFGVCAYVSPTTGKQQRQRRLQRRGKPEAGKPPAPPSQPGTPEPRISADRPPR